MIRILLIHFKIEHGSFVNNEQFPLGLGYLKSCLQNDKELASQIEVYIRSSLRKDTFEILDFIKKNNIQIVGFSCFLWNLESSLNMAKLIKAKSPHIKIVLGGPEVTFNSINLMKENNFIDFIVRGEGEFIFKNLVLYLINKNNNRTNLISKIRGITYRIDNKIIKSNIDSELIKNLDDIPSPFYDNALNLEEYTHTISYDSIRGCPYKCSYCLSGLLPQRRFSLERITKDIKAISRFNFKYLYILDTCFNPQLDWIRKFSNILGRFIKPPSKNVMAHSRFEYITKHSLKIFKKANIRKINLGLQSLNPNTLKQLNRKPIQKSFIAEVIELLLKERIDIMVDVILGLPGDNYKSFIDTINYLSSMPVRIYIHKLMLFRGISLRDNIKKFKIVFNHNIPYEIDHNYTFSSEDIKRAEDYIRRKSYKNERLRYAQV